VPTLRQKKALRNTQGGLMKMIFQWDLCGLETYIFEFNFYTWTVLLHLIHYIIELRKRFHLKMVAYPTETFRNV
jgi:hypothetical protein